MKSFQTARQAGVVATLAAAGSAWAQTCNYDLTTVAVPAPANVPSLSMLGVALLAAAVGFLAWRQGRFPGARFMAIVLVAAAAMLANQGGGGLVQKAYAAVVDVVLSNPAGENVSASANDGDEVVFRNTSGVALRIGSITPAPATCGEGTVISPGGTCTTTASCPVVSCEPGYVLENGECVPEPVFCGINEEVNPLYPTPPNQQCVCRVSFARYLASGQCVPLNVCSEAPQFQPTGEYVCN
jgi:hypothetical protein